MVGFAVSLPQPVLCQGLPVIILDGPPIRERLLIIIYRQLAFAGVIISAALGERSFRVHAGLVLGPPYSQLCDTEVKRSRIGPVFRRAHFDPIVAGCRG